LEFFLLAERILKVKCPPSWANAHAIGWSPVKADQTWNWKLHAHRTWRASKLSKCSKGKLRLWSHRREADAYEARFV